MIYSQIDSKILFSSDASNEVASAIKKHSRVFALTDENSMKYCFPIIKDALPASLPVFCIKPGEQNKNISTVTNLWEFLNQNGADRKSLLINLGGGLVCDLGGFAASTFKRGIDFIHVPTTLLSQVDASVGGKTGINLSNYKNEIGCFSFPSKVIIDTRFLETLDQENILSGFAEMLKHGFISSEDYFTELLHFKLDKPKINYTALLELVKQSVKIKEKIVLADPMETGLRKVLNFGHTVGHAFESFFMGTPHEISHGKAVAYGMMVELYLSHKKLGFPKEKLEECTQYIQKIYGRPNIQSSDYEVLYELMTHDKKNESALVNFTLLRNFGEPVFDQTASKEAIFEGLEFNQNFEPKSEIPK